MSEVCSATGGPLGARTCEGVPPLSPLSAPVSFSVASAADDPWMPLTASSPAAEPLALLAFTLAVATLRPRRCLRSVSPMLAPRLTLRRLCARNNSGVGSTLVPRGDAVGCSCGQQSHTCSSQP